MDDTALISLWQSYDQKLEQSLRLNRQQAEDISKLKVQSLLGSMKPVKLFAIIIGILWVIFLDALIINAYPYASPFFLVSAIIQVLISKIAIGIYLYQLILLGLTDLSEPVIATQEKLARLRSSTLLVTRILILQLPVWTTFYLNTAMFKNGNPWLLTLQLFVTVIFCCLAIWLFININYANRNKKWFRFIFSGREWEPMLHSMDLLSQVEEGKLEHPLH